MQLSSSLMRSRDLPPQSRDRLIGPGYVWSRDISALVTWPVGHECTVCIGCKCVLQFTGVRISLHPIQLNTRSLDQRVEDGEFIFCHISLWKPGRSMFFLSFDTLNTMRISIFTEYPIIMRFSRKFVYGIICFCHSDYNQSKWQKPIEETFNLTIIWYLMIDSWGTFYSESGKIENWGQCE